MLHKIIAINNPTNSSTPLNMETSIALFNVNVQTNSKISFAILLNTFAISYANSGGINNTYTQTTTIEIGFPLKILPNV